MQNLMKCAAIAALVLGSVAPVALATPVAHAQHKQFTAQEVASLIEQGNSAEEHDRDFGKALALYASALAASHGRLEGDLKALHLQARTYHDRLVARAAGIQPSAKENGANPENDPMVCRLMALLTDLHRFGPNTSELNAAHRDIALLGAIAVPWLEKAIEGPYELANDQCKYDISGNPQGFVRALAGMSAPEGIAALERVLSSRDPIARRAVAQYADATRHRAILLRALKDPAQAVRDEAINRLSFSEDLALEETMLGFVKEGNTAALGWFARFKAPELGRIANNVQNPAHIRRQALKALESNEKFRPDPQFLEGLLSLARAPHSDELRDGAMEALASGVSRTWKPVDSAMAEPIESAFMADPDAFPVRLTTKVWSEVASLRSLAALQGWASDEAKNNFQGTIMRALGKAGSGDFDQVVAVFAKSRAPVPGLGGSVEAGEWIHGNLLRWLESTAATDVSSATVAKGAATLSPALRQIYIKTVVPAWLDGHRDREGKLDPAFVGLLRELLKDSDTRHWSKVIYGLGASQDPSVLPDLLAQLPRSHRKGPEVTAAVEEAMGRITAADPKRARTILELLLTNPVLSASEFSAAYGRIIGPVEPEKLLAVIQPSWNAANAERLTHLVVDQVPGRVGSEFLLAHYTELGPGAADSRVIVINRLGEDLYEPAIDLIGIALQDPNSTVRLSAQRMFERFKAERAIADEFKAWRNEEKKAKQTISELLPLLDSSNSDVLIGAVKALAAMKARECYPKLILLLDKHRNDERLKAAVMVAIDELSK